MTEDSVSLDNWLNFSMLKLLVGVADHGSLSASARAAGVEQSNASRSIKTFERRIGYLLLKRSPQGSKLTQEGVITAEWAREALEALDRFAAGAQALSSTGSEELVIVTSMTIAEHLLPGWIGAFRAHRPEGSVRLRVMNSAQVIEAVKKGEAPLGFIETPSVPASMFSAPLWTDDLVVVASPTHPWAFRKDPLELTEIAATPLVEREEGSGTRAFLNLRVGSHRPAPILELNSNAAICETVIQGIGPSVLSRLAVGSYLRTGQLMEIATQSQSLTRTLQVIWKDSASLSMAARQFIEMLKSIAEKSDLRFRSAGGVSIHQSSDK